MTDKPLEELKAELEAAEAAHDDAARDDARSAANAHYDAAREHVVDSLRPSPTDVPF